MIFENDGTLDPEQVKSGVGQILTGLDMSLSLYVDSSVIARVNRNEQVALDSFFVGVFEKSREISTLTGGAFDPTVGPLVRAWGFSPGARSSMTDAKLDSMIKLVGMEKVGIKNGELRKTDPRVFLDFNAIAQGYSVDVICRYFDKLSIKNYLVEIGGEVRVRGLKNGNPWRIGVDRPEDNNMLPGKNLEAVILLNDRALATSGNYRKFYIENGIRYSHTIDPATGKPARNQLLSATILAGDCATADAVATACMVMGKEKSIGFLESRPEFEGYLICSDTSGSFTTWVSKSLIDDILEFDD
jgi:thiamine biosynthesis lipoprotein